MPDNSILCFINRCMNMWDIEPAKWVLIFLRQNLLYILASLWDGLPHQPAFSQVIWKVSTTHGKLRTTALWPPVWNFAKTVEIWFFEHCSFVLLGLPSGCLRKEPIKILVQNFIWTFGKFYHWMGNKNILGSLEWAYYSISQWSWSSALGFAISELKNETIYSNLQLYELIRGFSVQDIEICELANILINPPPTKTHCKLNNLFN